jgi:hypothetical protein
VCFQRYLVSLPHTYLCERAQARHGPSAPARALRRDSLRNSEQGRRQPDQRVRRSYVAHGHQGRHGERNCARHVRHTYVAGMCSQLGGAVVRTGDVDEQLHGALMQRQPEAKAAAEADHLRMCPIA